MQGSAGASQLCWAGWPCRGSTCGDAEVGLVWGHVVDPVVLPGQDDVPVLEENDPAWKAKVRVGPLVDLVGHGDEDDEGKDVTLPGTALTQCLCKTPQQL